MALISDRDERQFMQYLVPYEKPEPIPSFGETFAASLGQVWDEELSISSAMNNEMYADRVRLVQELSRSGEVDISQFKDRRGRIDYDAIADMDDRVPHSSALKAERNAILAQRRDYAKEVLERGNGFAQFLGMATGLVLDPVNVATMPVATAGTALRGMGTLARALTVARNEAALAAVAELAIQPLVYEHKHDIESPWEVHDALANIAMAAGGAFALGGAVGGISGYFRQARKATQALADTDLEVEEVHAILRQVETELEANPARAEVDFDVIERDFIREVREELLGSQPRKLSRGEREALQSELDDLLARKSQVTDDPIVQAKKKGVSARQQKREGINAGRRAAQEEIALFDERIVAIEQRLEADTWGRRAEADLTRLEQGIIPDRFQRRLDEIKQERLMEVDSEYLAKKQEVIDQANSRPPPAPERVVPEPARATETTDAQSNYLNENGLADDYHRSINEYDALESPQVVKDGQLVDARAVTKDMDDMLEGLEAVRVCAIG